MDYYRGELLAVEERLRRLYRLAADKARSLAQRHRGFSSDRGGGFER